MSERFSLGNDEDINLDGAHLTPLSNDDESIIISETSSQLEVGAKNEEHEPDIPRSEKFLFLVGMRPGIKSINLLMLIIFSGYFISLLSFMISVQQFVVQHYLHIPTEDQGKVIGDMAFYTEIIILCLGWIFGTLSDRIGTRKPFIIIGSTVVAVCLALMPFASSVLMLTFIRITLGIGTSACVNMIPSSHADYTYNKDRGKAMAIGGICNGLGATTALFIYLKLPLWLSTTTSLSEAQAGVVTFTAISVVQIAVTLLAVFFLHDGKIFLPPQETGSIAVPTEELEAVTPMISNVELHDVDRVETQVTSSNHRPIPQKGYLKLLGEGITLAIKDPIILLSYCASFIGRGDAMVITTFIALWVSQDALANDSTQTEALSLAGLITGITQMFAFLSGILFGFLADRFNKVILIGIVSLVGCVGYCSTYLLTSVTTGWVFISVLLIGFGEAGVFLLSQTLVTQAAPSQSRGSVIGAASICGNLGIMVATKIGGSIYRYHPAYPFVLMGVLNGALLIISIVVFIITKLRKKREENRIDAQLQ